MAALLAKNLGELQQERLKAEANLAAEHQKRMEDLSRRIQSVASSSANRLDAVTKTGSNVAQVMNQSHEKLAQQLRTLTDLLQEQRVLVEIQKSLAGNLEVVNSSSQLQHTLSGVSTFLSQLTPALTKLTQQVERLASSPASQDSGSGWRSWFRGS